MPSVLNIRDLDGRIPPGAVYIGRGKGGAPTKWGNLFTMNGESDRARVINNYREWLLLQPDLMEEARQELGGRDLVCFCAPKACHGDILIAVANGLDMPEALPVKERASRGGEPDLTLHDIF